MSILAEDNTICPTILTLSSGCSYNINYNHDQTGNVVLEFQVVEKSVKSSPFKVTVDETLAQFFQVGKLHRYRGSSVSSSASKSMAEIYTWSHLLARKPAGKLSCFDLDDETWFSDEENQESIVNPSLESIDNRMPIKLKLKPNHSRGGSFDSIGIEVEYSDGKPKVMEVSKYAWIKKGELEIHFTSGGGLYSQPELEINLGNNIIFPTYSDIIQDEVNQDNIAEDSLLKPFCSESPPSISHEDTLPINGEKLDRTDGSGDNGTSPDENDFSAEGPLRFEIVKDDICTPVVTESKEVQTMITFTPSENSEIEYNYQESSVNNTLSSVYFNDRFVLKEGKKTLSSIFSKDEDFFPQPKSESDSNLSWSTCNSYPKIKDNPPVDNSKSVVFINKVFEQNDDEIQENRCFQDTSDGKVENDHSPPTPVQCDVTPEIHKHGGGETVERMDIVNEGNIRENEVSKDSETLEKDAPLTEERTKALECGDLKSSEDIKVNKYHYVEDLKAYGAMQSLCEVGKQTIEKSNVVMKALLSVEKEINPLKEELYKLRHKVFDLDMPLSGLIKPSMQTTLRTQTKSSRVITSNTHLASPVYLNHPMPPVHPCNMAHFPGYYSPYSYPPPGYPCPCPSCNTCVAKSSSTSLPSFNASEGKEKLYREAIDSTQELKKLVTGMKDMYQRALLTKSESISMSGFPQDLSELKPRVSVSRKSISSGISWKKEVTQPNFVSTSIFSEPEDILGDL